MKIFFVDGEITEEDKERFVRLSENPAGKTINWVVIDAKYGVSKCFKILKEFVKKTVSGWGNCNNEKCRTEIPCRVVLTNAPFLLNECSWDKELRVPELFVKCSSGAFIRVDNLTNRELRKEHNLEKLFFGGEFSEGIENN